MLRRCARSMNTAAERTRRHYAQLRSRRLVILGEDLSVAALPNREDRRVAYGHGV